MTNKPIVGFVGWRGMVGSVLMARMTQKGDFAHITPRFFSTSNVGGSAPDVAGGGVLLDAYDIDTLAQCDIIISMQGSDYTQAVHDTLRARWTGYWIDAASHLRLREPSTIILDPINRHLIDKALNDGKKDFIGGNCTVSLMLMGLGGLFLNNAVQWVSAMTYQAASGAGANHMRELVDGMGDIFAQKTPSQSILELDKAVLGAQKSGKYPYFGAPLAGSLIPYIDAPMDNGQSKEEYKGDTETKKILGRDDLTVDGICVRIGAMRCHAQALTIKLKKNLDLAQVEDIIKSQNPWVDFIPNTKEDTVAKLTPVAVAGTTRIAVGRLRKLKMGDDYLGAFTVGDQLLWGAAEPLRRMLLILLGKV